ncbi:MAG: SPFH domain-containing protein [Candidatus Paceibacterota bacterium]
MWILLFVAFTLGVIALLVLLVLEARKEVAPATALVYNDIWTGRTYCALPGTVFIVPGIHRVLEREVSLRNEAENPSNVELVTGDGIELEVDYLVRRLQVGYPEMPDLDDPALDRKRLRECVIQAVTAIKYAERRDAILTRIVAYLQESLEKRTLNNLFPGVDLTTGMVGTVDVGVMQIIEEEVKTALLDDLVTQEWGFWVEIDLEDYNLPTIIRKARERSSAAEIAGKAIADKAKAAGVNPEWLVAGQAIADIFNKGQGEK